ncbi:FAD/NAD(P)-binding domain-containing protein [Durotheca rogersii]|uniref:FAD/NAD(P)-binding domain-containing protein n=1 Tax=Durotheca rogersii TaxID=419775 RepID=UPI00221F942A|nr:FAD/NAD(P)-binding domain-containing protein [Durotheca rogersii]KAI5861015.1 FAD/NAD(P)-binding domain-containing protein [Durotheca rogersii]
MPPSPSHPLRVAILGDSLAGASLLRALAPHAHVAAELLCARPAPRDEGPAVALTRGARRVLGALGVPPSSAFPGAAPARVRVAAGPHAGRDVLVSGPEDGGAAASRRALLDALLAGATPPHAVRVGARVVGIEPASPGTAALALVFADGARRAYDVVVAADGLHGAGRAQVLGLGGAAAAGGLRDTGYWGVHVEVPAGEAAGGEERATWVGAGTALTHGAVDGGGAVEVAVYGRAAVAAVEGEDAAAAAWARIFTPDEFRALFARSNWVPECRGLVELIQRRYTVHVTALNQLAPPATPTFAPSDAHAAALLGDAALTILPFPPAAPVVAALQQSLVLAAVLARVPSAAAAPLALRAYDRVVRPRAERAAADAAAAAALLTGTAPGVGTDAEALGAALAALRADEPADDVEALIQEGLGVLAELLHGGQ